MQTRKALSLFPSPSNSTIHEGMNGKMGSGECVYAASMAEIYAMKRAQLRPIGRYPIIK
jgi:hypothetical protein